MKMKIPFNIVLFDWFWFVFFVKKKTQPPNSFVDTNIPNISVCTIFFIHIPSHLWLNINTVNLSGALINIGPFNIEQVSLTLKK